MVVQEEVVVWVGRALPTHEHHLQSSPPLPFEEVCSWDAITSRGTLPPWMESMDVWLCTVCLHMKRICMHVYAHVCMYVHMYACVCICMHACMYVHMYACCTHVCMRVHMHACTHTHMYACMHICMHVNTCMHACMHACDACMHASKQA